MIEKGKEGNASLSLKITLRTANAPNRIPLAGQQVRISQMEKPEHKGCWEFLVVVRKQLCKEVRKEKRENNLPTPNLS